jgi:hypothetical protein
MIEAEAYFTTKEFLQDSAVAAIGVLGSIAVGRAAAKRGAPKPIAVAIGTAAGLLGANLVNELITPDDPVMQFDHRYHG